MTGCGCLDGTVTLLSRRKSVQNRQVPSIFSGMTIGETYGEELASMAPRASISRTWRCISLRFAAECRYGGTRNGVSSVTWMSCSMKLVCGSGPVSSNTAAWHSRDLPEPLLVFLGKLVLHLFPQLLAHLPGWLLRGAAEVDSTPLLAAHVEAVQLVVVQDAMFLEPASAEDGVCMELVDHEELKPCTQCPGRGKSGRIGRGCPCRRPA